MNGISGREASMGVRILPVFSLYDLIHNKHNCYIFLFKISHYSKSKYHFTVTIYFTTRSATICYKQLKNCTVNTNVDNKNSKKLKFKLIFNYIPPHLNKKKIATSYKNIKIKKLSP